MGRSDKKTQFAPCVPIWLKEVVQGIGQHLGIPMGDAAAQIVMEASRHASIINKLAPYFWRTLERGDHVWLGHDDCRDIVEIVQFPYERCERLKMRFTQSQRREVDDIIFALAVPGAHAMAALLILAIHDKRIIQSVAPGYTPSSRYAIERRAAKWHGYSVR